MNITLTDSVEKIIDLCDEHGAKNTLLLWLENYKTSTVSSLLDSILVLEDYDFNAEWICFILIHCYTQFDPEISDILISTLEKYPRLAYVVYNSIEDLYTQHDEQLHIIFDTYVQTKKKRPFRVSVIG